MTYRRVIPRDLFNEASLLKCYGHLWLALDRPGHRARLSEGLGGAFVIEQEPGSGDISITNLPFTIAGRPYRLTRPLNSRQPWPLYATDEADEDTEVFAVNGALTNDFLRLIEADWVR